MAVRSCARSRTRDNARLGALPRQRGCSCAASSPLPRCSARSCSPAARARAVSDWPIRLGRPYTVRGTSYVPAAAPGYDAVGYASWYGCRLGRGTANGERYRACWISGAHTTLPLPSYLAVTALDRGRTVVVRGNDRGPFSPIRILDLSRGVAALLETDRAGRVAVHVHPVREQCPVARNVHIVAGDRREHPPQPLAVRGVLLHRSRAVRVADPRRRDARSDRRRARPEEGAPASLCQSLIAARQRDSVASFFGARGGSAVTSFIAIMNRITVARVAGSGESAWPAHLSLNCAQSAK